MGVGGRRRSAEVSGGRRQSAEGGGQRVELKSSELRAHFQGWSSELWAHFQDTITQFVQPHPTSLGGRVLTDLSAGFDPLSNIL